MKRTAYRIGVAACALAACLAWPVVHAQEAAPSPQTPLLMLNDGDGVRNSGFEDWIEGAPRFWQVRGPEANLALRETSEVRTGHASMRCEQGAPWVAVRQRVHVFGNIGGKTLRITVWARVAEPGAEVCLVVLQDGTRIEALPHPGDGKWHEIVLTHVFPADSDPAWFDIVLGRARDQKRPCLFDGVRLVVE